MEETYSLGSFLGTLCLVQTVLPWQHPGILRSGPQLPALEQTEGASQNLLSLFSEV